MPVNKVHFISTATPFSAAPANLARALLNHRKSSASKPLPSTMLFNVPMGNGFAAVHGHNRLPSVCMTPFLVAAGLPYQFKAMLAQNLDDFLGVANWKPLAHGMASSMSFAPLCSLTGEGSNQSSNASFALAMASASVSPAEAQPGNSGKTTDQRFVSESNSTKRRNFMSAI